MNNTEELVRKVFCHYAVFKEGYESKQLQWRNGTNRKEAKDENSINIQNALRG